MYTVLLADDEHIEIAFLRSVLQGAGNAYRVAAEARNGRQAIDLAKSLQPDAAILDINMPIVNGLEAAKEIKTLSPRTVVILNSAYAEFNFAQQAIDYDVDAYLIKPADAQLIVSTLEGCLCKRSLRAGPGTTLGFPPEETYPYELQEKLLAGIASRNSRVATANMEAYLQFFHNQQAHHGHYQLFILNTLFSIRHELHKVGIPDEFAQLLSDHVYMDHIGKAESWYEVLLHLEEYFTRLRLLLEGCEGGGHSCMSQVVQYLEQHYTENITLNDLAKLVHLSPAYLSRRFHQEQGMPIRDYITRKRMERARCLLQTSRFSIKEISESCGFSNVSHFYRICKEHTGLSPAQMRQQGPSGED